MMHCSKSGRTFSSLLLILVMMASCASPYRGLQKQRAPKTTALKYKPAFDKALYRCVVNGRVVFKKFHLSGLLFFKNLDNGSTRAVFQNEMGFTFFDFEWSSGDSFKVNRIIPQLDKPALIKTLHKDMNLLLMKGLNNASEETIVKGGETYHRFDLEKGVAYYIEQGGKLQRIENAGKSKVITIILTGKKEDQAMPDAVVFKHHKANFTIRLTKLEDHADE